MGTGSGVRAQAARAVLTVVQGRSLGQMEPADGVDAALFQEMVYGTLRWYLRLRAMSALLLERPLREKDADVGTLVLIGLYQLIYMRIPDHAAVSQTVAATADLGKPWARGLVNALLRRAGRERDGLAALLATPEAQTAHPGWLVEALKAAWPRHWRDIVAADNARPPMTLRVNLRRSTRAQYLEQLAAAGIGARAPDRPSTALVLETPVAVARLPGFDAGLVSVQDASAQLAADLVDAGAGDRVLDACAAPGGKTAHLLERSPAPGELVALDIDAGRLGRVRENLDRLQLEACVVTGDAARPEAWWDGRPFDRILLDAPCSGSGVIRRHPDIRLLRKPHDIEQMAVRQRQMLAALWPLLRRGGKLVYSTCSVLPLENAVSVADFLRQQTGARDATPELPWGRRVEAGWQTLPGEGEGDGFYYACIDKI